MDVKLITLNCNGLKGNFVYVKDLANKYDFSYRDMDFKIRKTFIIRL